MKLLCFFFSVVQYTAHANHNLVVAPTYFYMIKKKSTFSSVCVISTAESNDQVFIPFQDQVHVKLPNFTVQKAALTINFYVNLCKI